MSREPDLQETELSATIHETNKTYGVGTIHSARHTPPITYLHSGVFSLDYALYGGIPEGFATQIYGLQSSGKTTLAYRYVASALGKYPEKSVMWLDLEGTFDPDWATQNGVADLDRLFIAKPDTGELAVDIAEAAMNSLETSLVVVDSVPALIPFKTVEESAQKDHIAATAKLVGKLCSRVTQSWTKEKKRGHYVTVIFINQFRTNIGQLYGDPRILPGGRQLQYIPSVSIEVKNKENRGKGENENGMVEFNEHSFSITKAKVPTATRVGEFNIVTSVYNPLGIGSVDDYSTVIAKAKSSGLITGGGKSWKCPTVTQDVFGKLSDIQELLIANADAFLHLKRTIILAERQRRNMPALPKDNFLIGYVST